MPPLERTGKINTAASYLADLGAATAGIVAYDHLGTVLFAAACNPRNCSSADGDETKAILEGICLSIEFGCINW